MQNIRVLFALLLLPTAAYSTLLITGCGRSGTNFIAKFFETAGYDIHHERQGRDGCVSWSMTVNHYAPCPNSDANEDFDHIFHQVRHPLDVISSWYNNYENLDRYEWNFVRTHLPQIDRSDSLILHCAKYWYYWNLLAEEQAEWRYRIEDIEEILPELATRSGLHLQHSILAEIPKNYNSWKEVSKISWHQLKAELPETLYNNIINMSIRYGYYEPRQIGDTMSEVLVLGVQYPKADSGEATFITPMADAKIGGKLF